MENASKALIMAGGVLIALMIIGALVLMFSNLSTYQKSNIESDRDSQIVEFNNKYETYNKQNLRGSELYSLLNKVIDYNRRQSTEGTGITDQGQSIAFEPMTITFSIDRSKLSAEAGSAKLFASNSYEISGNSNQFENAIKENIDNLENKYGQDSLTNLTTGLTRIFIDSNNDTEKEEAVKRFNSASRKVKISNFNEITKNSTIRNEVYEYYEYIQFKRALFKCTGTTYNKKTGRITEMKFEFTGKFN